MDYSERMNELMDRLNKSIASVNKLDYFKKEILKILDSKDKKEETLSKAIDDYFNSMNKSLFDEFGIEKGRVGTVGEIRTWKDGKKYKKMPNGKWVRVYQQMDRHAEISIARLKGKVKNAQSIDELMNIVMNNIHRFEDENGNVLPVVEELKKEVAASKGKINAGKPSTQEQIEKFKKEQQKKNISANPYTSIPSKELKIGDKIHTMLGDLTITSIKKGRDYIYCDVKEDPSIIKFRKQGFAKLINENYRNEFTDYIDDMKKQAENLFNKDIEINEKLNKLVEIRETVRKHYNDIRQNLNNSDTDTSAIRDYNNRQFYDYIDYINVMINKTYAQTPEQIEKKRKADEERSKKKSALEIKLDSINKNYKYDYTDEEISKAFKDAESVENEIQELKKEYLNLQHEKQLNENAIKNRKNELGKMYGKQITPNLYSTPYDKLRTDEEYLKLDAIDDDLRNQSSNVWSKLKAKETEIDKYMDPIADYYLKMDWKKDSKIDTCGNIDDVVSLIKSKDWYGEAGKKAIDLKGIDIECGKLIFKCLERIFAIFPERKGKNVSLNTEYRENKIWAEGSYWSGITFNKFYWKDYRLISVDVDNTTKSFHPDGTTINSVIFHEYYHTITTKNDLARIIKNKVSDSLKLNDRKSGVKKDELIARGISEYATKNADEFGAEAFGECLSCKNPSAFAREVFKETIKHVKYLKDDVGGII